MVNTHYSKHSHSQSHHSHIIRWTGTLAMGNTHYSSTQRSKVDMDSLPFCLSKVLQKSLYTSLYVLLPHHHVHSHPTIGASPSACGSSQRPAWVLAAYHGYHKVNNHNYHHHQHFCYHQHHHKTTRSWGFSSISSQSKKYFGTFSSLTRSMAVGRSYMRW